MIIIQKAYIKDTNITLPKIHKDKPNQGKSPKKNIKRSEWGTYSKPGNFNMIHSPIVCTQIQES